MKALVVAALSLHLVACNGDTIDSPQESGLDTAAEPGIQLVGGNTPSLWGGDVAVPEVLPEGRKPNVPEFSDTLSSLTESAVSLREEQDRYVVVSDRFEGFVTKVTNHFQVSLKESEIVGTILERSVNGLHAPSVSPPKGRVHPDDDAMLQSARALTTNLGASDSELEEAVVRSLNSIDPNEVKKTHARKVFISRRVAGLEQPSGSSVTTFGMDGRLRSIRGQWTPYENGGRLLKSALVESKEELLEYATQKAFERDPALAAKPRALRVTVRLEFDEEKNPNELQLQGLVIVPSAGSGGEYTETAIPFEL